MKIEKIYSQIIDLTKEIFFHPPNRDIGITSQFFAGDHNLPIPLFGIALKWWYSKKALKLCDNIAKMSMEFDKELTYGDIKDLSETIKTTFQRNATNKELFQIFSNNPNTLFDSRTERDIQEYSKTIWHTLHESMLHSLTKWLILYPLPGIVSNSHNLHYDGLHIIESEDSEYWDQFKATYPAFSYLDFVAFKNAEGQKILNIDPPKSWLMCEISGTENKSRFYASLFMRKFIAVLFSFLRESNQRATSKSMRDVNLYCIQLPSVHSNMDVSSIFSSIGTLIHPILSEIKVRDVILDTVDTWYTHSEKLDNDRYHRASKASHFLNYALVTDGIQQFLYYFIVLDALFGVRNHVEEFIKNGTGRYLTEPEWQQKVDKLFDLRSELVHGASSYIEEWKGYDRYVSHFGSYPERDVEVAASKCLREYVFSK